MIPHSRPTRAPGDVEAVARVLASGRLAAGPEVAAFEEAFARRVGRARGIATASGQAALHLALLGLGVGRGDRVAIPSYACTALLNAVRYVGAEPVLVDAGDPDGPDPFNLDPEGLARARPLAAAIAPHLFGFPADIPALRAAAGAPIIEDCAMAAGARDGGREAGAAGEVAIFSFYATKMLSTGQGGMLLCDDEGVAARVRDLSTYDEREEYRVRYNYAMTDIQAVLGRLQLARLDAFVAARRAIAARYDEAFGRPVPCRAGTRPAFFRYPIRLPSDPRAAARRLAGLGVEAKPPVFRPVHRYLGLDPAAFPRAEALDRSVLSIPIYPGLTDEESRAVIEAVKRVL
ncbi:MAG: DegT/DnrJ/EryC1/StrS aminotransferase family protein [Planctomycetes bacterium]|nr:DegT/DnrJ/EryC1/StrS aminotransferase family protein [Planctomycetota bacterium]